MRTQKQIIFSFQRDSFRESYKSVRLLLHQKVSSWTYCIYLNKRRGAYLNIVSDKFTFSIFLFNGTLSTC